MNKDDLQRIRDIRAMLQAVRELKPAPPGARGDGYFEHVSSESLNLIDRYNELRQPAKDSGEPDADR